MATISPSNFVELGYMSRCSTLACANDSNTSVRKWYWSWSPRYSEPDTLPLSPWASSSAASVRTTSSTCSRGIGCSGMLRWAR